MKIRRHAPEEGLLRPLLLALGGQILLLYLAQWWFMSGEQVFSAFYQSRDFIYFYDAARAWLAGLNPYDTSGFVTPPPSLLIPALLARLPLERAAECFLYFNFMLVPLVFWWYSGRLGIALRSRILLVMVAGLFISTHESLRGGNLDGLMFALLLVCFGLRGRAGGAMAMAGSIVLKVYSTLFFIVAVRRRQWRFVLSSMGFALLFLLPFVRLWPSMLNALLYRQSRFSTRSIAPSALVNFVSGEAGHGATLLCYAFWLVTLIGALWRDQERELSPSTLARYTPWMLSFPSLVFSYVGILALAIPLALASTLGRRALHWGEKLAAVGFVLLGIRVDQLVIRIPVSYFTYTYVHSYTTVVQSLGVVLMMIGMCFAPSGIELSGGEPHEAGEEAAFVSHSLSDRSRQELSSL